jgi:hypothetical protein
VTARAASSATATVHDDAIAAIIRLYDQPDYLVNVSRIPDCGVAYARASGLTPLSQFRFAWMSEPGVIVRVTPVVTSETGTCEDELALTPEIAGGGWRAEIQRWDGFAWSPLDQAAFDVGDGWRMDALQPQQGRHHLTSARVAASAVMRRDPWALPVADEIRWRVLTPDRSSLLDVTGAFIAFDGTASTAVESIVLDEPEEGVSFAVSNVTFPSPGTYVVEAWRTSACSVERLAGATVIEVVDDADLDGLTRDEELAAGTDPGDDDGDDDGLPDLADGTSDTDGDGLVDALDCDSDDDGVLDGTEAGVTAPASGTRAGSPCFVPDASPATTTSPDVGDTDGGGRSDGDEDRDRNGRVDAGELDPNDATDDFAGCATTPPAAIRDLRVTRAGEGVSLSWTAEADPCVTHVVLVSDALPDFTEAAGGLTLTSWTGGGAQPGALRAFSVRADSLLAGPGAP